MSLEAYILPSNQDWCRGCNDPHVQNYFPIFQHQTRLARNDGVSIDYYVDERESKANMMILSESTNRVVEIRFAVR